LLEANKAIKLLHFIKRSVDIKNALKQKVKKKNVETPLPKNDYVKY